MDGQGLPSMQASSTPMKWSRTTHRVVSRRRDRALGLEGSRLRSCTTGGGLREAPACRRGRGLRERLRS